MIKVTKTSISLVFVINIMLIGNMRIDEAEEYAISQLTHSSEDNLFVIGEVIDGLNS